MGEDANPHAMSPRVFLRPGSSRLRLMLLLACLALLAAGCATMSKPQIGIGGSDENTRPIGH